MFEKRLFILVLFILVMKVLSRMLTKVVEGTQIFGFRVEALKVEIGELGILICCLLMIPFFSFRDGS